MYMTEVLSSIEIDKQPGKNRKNQQSFLSPVAQASTAQISHVIHKPECECESLGKGENQ